MKWIHRKKMGYFFFFFFFLFFLIKIFFHHSSNDFPGYEKIFVQRGDLSLFLTATGLVDSVNRLEIKPPLAGRMEKVLKKEGDFVHKGEILGWMSSTERALLLDAARSQSPEELSRWEDFYRPSPLIAPLSGTLIVKNVESGQTFSLTDILFVLSDRLIIKAYVDETDVAEIFLKQQTEIILDAYPGIPLDGFVQHISYEAKTVHNVTNYIIHIIPEKTLPLMRSGMTANITFFIKKLKNILLVPQEAIEKKENGKSFVYVLSPSGSLITKEVVLGSSDGKKTEIKEGLAEKEMIFTPDKHMMPGFSQPIVKKKSLKGF